MCYRLSPNKKSLQHLIEEKILDFDSIYEANEVGSKSFPFNKRLKPLLILPKVSIHQPDLEAGTYMLTGRNQ